MGCPSFNGVHMGDLMQTNKAAGIRCSLCSHLPSRVLSALPRELHTGITWP